VVSSPSASSSASTRRAAPLPAGERRAAIIAAALPLLIEHGSTATTRQIATAAGVSEGTIFNAFADKDDLLQAALETAIDHAPFERAVAAIDPDLPFEHRLTRATELIQRRIVDIWRLVSQLGPHHRDAHRRPLPDSAALAALIASQPDALRTDPADAARLLRALTLSLTHPMLATRPRAAGEIVDVFLNGTARHRAGS
jgi:AcrR family transcriptional regulator